MSTPVRPERLLFDHGAVDRLGSVDAGDTRTDDGAIERRRGISVRSAVAAFTVGDTQVNLIDTPGHSDFVTEVERALGVLDGAVLLSAVEGVQARTRLLMRTLRRLRLPTLVFVNEIDRAGARTGDLLGDIRRLLTPHVAPLTQVTGAGTARARVTRRPPDERTAEALAEVDPDITGGRSRADRRGPDRRARRPHRRRIVPPAVPRLRARRSGRRRAGRGPGPAGPGRPAPDGRRRDSPGHGVRRAPRTRRRADGVPAAVRR
ncbi:hypothetical protein GCM10010279_20270 [Streptomyces mutabilis]|nr:hypothetical protein GCM10010279_20270 [Streptomyces mutabilis]